MFFIGCVEVVFVVEIVFVINKGSFKFDGDLLICESGMDEMVKGFGMIGVVLIEIVENGNLIWIGFYCDCIVNCFINCVCGYVEGIVIF